MMEVIYNSIAEVTKEDLSCSIVDEFGAKYSKDGKRLLRVPVKTKTYTIKYGTEVICNNAFDRRIYLQEVLIPNSVKIIGKYSFCKCKSLKHIKIPNSVNAICEGAFAECHLLNEIELPKALIKIDDYTFTKCTSLQTIRIPNNTSVS